MCRRSTTISLICNSRVIIKASAEADMATLMNFTFNSRVIITEANMASIPLLHDEISCIAWPAGLII